MPRHNNAITYVHLRKHWQKRVRTWFNQPARKRRRLDARKEKKAKLFPRPLEKLRPLVRCPTVRYNRKIRQGRGFTLEEIKGAKLGMAFAQSIGISVDHRRRNKSQEELDLNIKRLQAYLQKLVLFPKVQKKYKKGLINDSTADVVEKVQVNQNEDAKLMALEPASQGKRVKPTQITQQMKKFRAYRQLRLEREVQRVHGKKMQKEKEK